MIETSYTFGRSPEPSEVTLDRGHHGNGGLPGSPGRLISSTTSEARNITAPWIVRATFTMEAS